MGAAQACANLAYFLAADAGASVTSAAIHPDGDASPIV
jgi:hypothetical protein